MATPVANKKIFNIVDKGFALICFRFSENIFMMQGA